MMKQMIQLIRLEQWLKNLFVFLPLFFSGKMVFDNSFCRVLWAFFAFSLAASSVYVVNDLLDATSDRLHPTKCKRPLASGRVSRNVAWQLSLFCLLASLVISWLFVGTRAAWFVAGYLVLNVAYCIKLKHVAILDVMIVSLGYIFRLVVGGVAAGVVLSQWIVLMTFLLALFLALAKRRDDVLIYEQEGVKTRGNILQYNLSFINTAMSVMAAVMVVCYVMYTVSPEVTHRLHTTHLYLTTLFVIAGVLRYMQVTFVYQQSGSPTRVLWHDHFLQLCVIGWALAFVFVIYC